MTKLQDVPTDELRAEILRRQEAERCERLAAHAEHEQLIFMHVEALLQLAPKHERSTCSDANYANYHDRRCRRCALIYARGHHDFPYWLRLNLEDFER